MIFKASQTRKSIGLNRMEHTGLIARKPDLNDRRHRLIVLTEQAKSLRDDYRDISQKMNKIWRKIIYHSRILWAQRMAEITTG